MNDAILQSCVGFEWDEGNLIKNLSKHQVSYLECEEVFFNTPLILAEDAAHSQKELRYYVLGKTENKRLLFMAFTIRKKRIRIISARPMSKKERVVYETQDS